MKALAVDLGGSHATCALLEDRTILGSKRLPLDSSGPLRAALPSLAAAFRALLEESHLRAAECAGVAFGTCGIVDSPAGRVLSTNGKWDDAPGIDFPGWSRNELSLPLRIENDARMALLGEWYAGAGRGSQNLAMLTLGTGIGSAVILEGKLLRGPHSQAGNLGGHQPVLFNGRKCTCGGFGCAEAEAGGWSLPLIAREWPGFAESALAHEPAVNFEALFRLAARADRLACAIRDRCLRVWAAATINIIHAFDCELVVFGGAVMNSAEAILPYIQEYVSAHAWTPWGKVQIRRAELGDHAGLLGAVPLLTSTY